MIIIIMIIIFNFLINSFLIIINSNLIIMIIIILIIIVKYLYSAQSTICPWRFTLKKIIKSYKFYIIMKRNM